MLLDYLWLCLEYLGHGQEAQILEVLITILNEQSQLGHTQLHSEEHSVKHAHVTARITIYNLYQTIHQYAYVVQKKMLIY